MSSLLQLLLCSGRIERWLPPLMLKYLGWVSSMGRIEHALPPGAGRIEHELPPFPFGDGGLTGRIEQALPPFVTVAVVVGGAGRIEQVLPPLHSAARRGCRPKEGLSSAPSFCVEGSDVGGTGRIERVLPPPHSAAYYYSAGEQGTD
jgi:hypothetical protein